MKIKFSGHSPTERNLELTDSELEESCEFDFGAYAAEIIDELENQK